MPISGMQPLSYITSTANNAWLKATDDKARRFSYSIIYRKKDGAEVDITERIEDYVMSWSYTDNLTGAMDTLNLQLVDKNRRWIDKWYPRPGAILKMWIVVENWKRQGDGRKKELGAFAIDSIQSAFPPASVTLQARSLPLTSTASRQLKMKAWENTTLQTIAGDIAKASKLKLRYKGDPIKYDRIEQTNQTDLEFLYKITSENNQCMQIKNGELLIFDESFLEGQEPVLTITPESKIASWEFKSDYTEVFKDAIVASRNSKKKTTVKGTAKDSSVPKDIERTLVIKKRCANAEEAQRLARNALRKKNKKMYSANILLAIGDPDVTAGCVVELKDFGKFSMRYLVEQAVHSGGSGGYTTAIRMRGIRKA